MLTIGVPWSEAGSRFTVLFEALVIDWLGAASISAVARLPDLSWDQVSGVMERAVKRGLERRGSAPASRVLGVDETSFRKRHEYVTVVADIEGEPRV
ncbi:MAG: ISL3 family transposase, partial [Chloroflexota bacterium]|nr:ISL3 family transposase [Chloroflexota bacterium]